VIAEMGATAEGVHTTRAVWEFAQQHQIAMPITEGVYRLLRGEINAEEAIRLLMTRAG
jgi:glycerol-3-phosphate dehydrogenase (NAD(P)+)